jgi:APA family basic amino acid/polyamine antiporter
LPRISVTKKSTRGAELKKTLSLFDATAISIGAIVGAGIFVVTGIVAGLAGPALVISMLIAAIISIFTALSVAELAAWMPREGGIYEYGRRLISPFAGFLTGWMWMVSNIFAGAAVSLGFANYFAGLIPILPITWIAAILCMAFTFLNYLGVRHSALTNNILVILKLLILAFFITLGLRYMDATNFTPFFPSEIGLFYGAYYIFFAYGGFARVAVVAEEIKDAKKNVPRAIVLSLVISTVVYVLVGIVAIGLVGTQVLSGSGSPLTQAISITGSATAVYIVSAGGLIATASVLLTSILGVSRMAYAMAREKDLPTTLGKIHSKHRTPYYAIWIIGFLMVLLVLFIDLSQVVSISTFAMLFYYAMANISAIRLKPRNRTYSWIIPVLGALTCLALLTLVFLTSLQTWVVGLVGLLAGAVWYGVRSK